MPLVDVYTAVIPDEVCIGKLYPEQRWIEIEGCASEKVRRQKYCVWKLLEYALERSLGLDVEQMHFERGENGKWTADGVYFSLSHSDNVVAVCVSRAAVGVDVERVTDRLEAVRRKFLTKGEESEYCTQDDKRGYLAEKWTQKESIFKMLGGKRFVPSAVITDDYTAKSIRLNGADGYILSVAAEDLTNLRVYQNVDYKL